MNGLGKRLLTALSIFLCIGCSDHSNGLEDYLNLQVMIEVSKAEPDGRAYSAPETINDPVSAMHLYNILQKAHSSNAIVSMSRNSDYKITVSNTNPAVSSEPIVYGIWLSEESSSVSIVTEIGSGYVQLDLADSKKIRAILLHRSTSNGTKITKNQRSTGTLVFADKVIELHRAVSTFLLDPQALELQDRGLSLACFPHFLQQ